MSATPKPADSTSSHRSRMTIEAYEAIKGAICSGELHPRERLYETVLAKRLKMSRTPVREALLRLVNEGLAEAGPDGGWSGGDGHGQNNPCRPPCIERPAALERGRFAASAPTRPIAIIRADMRATLVFSWSRAALD